MERIVVINVLDEDTYENCHIPGTLNVPISDLAEYAHKSLAQDAHIVVHCARPTCPLSREAYELLDKAGYVNVRAFEGGMAEWAQRGYPTVGVCDADYLKDTKQAPHTDKMRTVSADELARLLGLQPNAQKEQ